MSAPVPADVTRPLRIGNFSGFYGDRFAALAEMLDGEVDVLTGDYLAELTMLILARDRAKDPDSGYAKTFLRQLEASLGVALERGVRIVTNAGGLNPAGLAAAIGSLAERLGLAPRIAYVTGDDVRDRFENVLAANAYLGAWGIKAGLESGADLVVTGRVTDASLVVGAAAAHFGWSRTDFDAIAGAMVAGHVIECGPQATGGNYAFFTELADVRRPGFPVAEVFADGSAVITKPAGTGGAVTVDTVTAQLLYEIGGPAYAGPDAVARFDTIELAGDGPDRIRIGGVQGLPPPPTVKVSLNSVEGFRNEMTFVLTGPEIGAKAALVQAQLERPDAVWTLERTGDPDSDDEAGASALLRCVVRGPDAGAIGREFSDAVVQLALASYPGFHLTTPPGLAQPVGVFRAGYLPQGDVEQVVVRSDGGRLVVEPPAVMAELPDEHDENPIGLAIEPVTRVQFGRVIGARSGDKGGDANLGVWVRRDDEFEWLRAFLTVERVQQLLPELRPLRVDRYVLPTLRALNFVVHGLLGLGVAWNARFDPQAKALGEWLRGRQVEVPDRLLRPEIAST